MAKPIIVSGIQPTGNLHVGNYLGAVKNWVDVQKTGKYQPYFFIADYHSLTGNMSADERREKIMIVATELLAAGIDPKKSTLFAQSDVPEHTELAWIFNTLTPLAELYRMTQFKDKSEHQDKNINTGLLTYPVLQVADILLYHGTFVPVGLDQVQHVELTRDIARWFNNRYGNFFPEAKVLLTETPKVMSLTDPNKKMSKSHGTQTVIELDDTPDVIAQKLKKAVTANEGGGEAPGVANLLTLLKHFGSSQDHAAFVKAEKDKTIRYGDLKTAVGMAIAAHLEDFRERKAYYVKHPRIVRAVLDDGAARARKIAQKTMKDVRTMVGLR